MELNKYLCFRGYHINGQKYNLNYSFHLEDLTKQL